MRGHFIHTTETETEDDYQEVTVRHYSGGGRDQTAEDYQDNLGTITIDLSDWAQYEAGAHPDFQWPEGIARAGDVIEDEILGRLGIDPDTTIWLD